MNIEARLIDGPRGGELLTVRDIRNDLLFARLRPLSSRDFMMAEGPVIEPEAIETIRYTLDHAIVFYRYGGVA